MVLLIISGVVFISRIDIDQVWKFQQQQQEQEQQDQERKKLEKQEFPELKNSKEVSFNWEFNNREYKLTTTLHESVYEFYNEQPKEYTCIGSCSPDWKEKYYGTFLQVPEEDNTFKELISTIKEKGEQQGLSDSQILEMTVSFIQSIPYDEIGIKEELPLARYPYEVLYEKKGVCSGKSFLGALLVKELGYGVALFSYEKENHMAIGIKCEKQVSSYNSGYCFTELTNPGWKIGIEDFNDIKGIRPSERTPVLSNTPEVYVIADGKTYRGVYKNLEKKEEIKELEQEIDQREIKINNLKEKLDRYKRIGDYESYNELVPTYNNLINTQRAAVERYDVLIREFTPGR